MNTKKIKDAIKTLSEEKQELAKPILEKLVFMEKTLKELEEEISENGVVIDMCQGSYSIKRSNPAIASYNTMIKNYNLLLDELNKILPNELNQSDGFDDFGSDDK